MLKSVKSAMYNIGDGTGHLAKRVGSETADLAKRVGSETADIAKRVGSSTADIAKRVGPQRAIIGVAVIGVVVVGSIFLVRYLRVRKEELPLEGSDEQVQERGAKRHARRGPEAQFSH
jgi:hypothetical protein